MKKGVFLFVVIAFAILSGFVFYLDSFLDCGSVICLKNYITGNVIFEEQVLSTGNVIVTPENEGSLNGFFENLIEIIISPFVGNQESGSEGSGGTVLLGPSHILTPGSGWSGITAVPSPNGSPGQYGYNANVIAHWDHVPFQDVEGAINVGVLAYHISGIQRVSFSVNNGPWVDVTTTVLNPQTNVSEYWVVLNESLFPSNFAGNAEIRAIAYPNVGTPKVLQGTSVIKQDSSMIVSVDRAGTLPDNVAYVTSTGSDSNNCLTQGTACATISRAMNAVAVGGSLDGAEVRLGEGSWTLPSSSGFSTTNRWFTITSIAGTNRDNVIISGYSSGTPTSKYKLSRLSLIRGANLYYPMGEVWIDNSKIYKPTTWTCADGSYEGGDMLGYAGPEGGNEYHSYFTDIYINNTGHGPSNLILGRNIIAEVTNDAHASGSMTLINYFIKDVIQDCGVHADYYQFFANYDDIIIKGGGNIPGGSPVTRGLATSSEGLIDVAIDNINLSWNGWVFSVCGPNVRNIIIKDSYFGGSGNWCGESPTPTASFNAMNMSNILIQDSTFNFGNSFNLPLNPITLQPVPSPTVTYVTTSSTQTCNNVTQYGITWTFNQSYPCGQFVNGDWWVVPNAPGGVVRITSVSPTPVYGTNGRHGTMINPMPETTAYDSRPTLAEYNPALGINFPRDVSTSSSVVSTISNPDSTQCTFYGGLLGWIPPIELLYDPSGPICNPNGYLKTAAVLTVLNNTPSTGSFRPPIGGTDKTIRYNEADLDIPGRGYSLLKTLPILPSPSIPLATSERRFQRLNLGHISSYSRQFITPADNSVGYGQSFSKFVSEALINLNLNYTNSEKRNLLINFLQSSIDHYRFAELGVEWIPEGGQGGGREVLIIIGGLLLGDDGMMNVLSLPGECFGGICFGESGSIFYVNETSPGVWNYGFGGYTSADKGIPEWGTSHDRNPSADARDWWGPTGYRRCCTAYEWIGEVVAIHMMGVDWLWEDRGFIDYTDRYVEVQKNQGSGNDLSSLLPYWDAYRNNYGCTWTRDNPNDIYSQGYYDCNGAAAGEEYKCTWANSTRSSAVLVDDVSDYTSQRAIDYDPCNVPLAPRATCSSISQYGITWTFNQSYECGQFITGDWWVVGPVTVTSISPGAQNIGGRWVHGSMINPITLPFAPWPTLVCPNGYDSALQDQQAYSASLNKGLVGGSPVSPSNPLVVSTSSSLISTISDLTNTEEVLLNAAVLTVLNQTPPAGAFRPPYVGNDKTIRFTDSNVNYDALASLPLLSNSGTRAQPDNTPSIASQEARFEKVWLEHCAASDSDRMRPKDNWPTYYADYTSFMGDAALVLNSNYLISQKKKLADYMVQLGIDRYGAYQPIGFDFNTNGHQNGRKFPILFAGALLNDQNMLNVGENYPTIFNGAGVPGNTPGDGVLFSEDGQPFYVNETTPGGPNWGVGGYLVSDRGLPEWGNFHVPSFTTGWTSDDDNRGWTANGYRSCCSASGWHGTVLSMQIVGIKDKWNQDAFFDYTDRFMSIGGGLHSSAFAEHMWEVYRNQFGCTWIRDNPADLYSQGYYDCNGAAAGEEYKCTWANSARSSAVLVDDVSDYTSQRAIDYDPCNVALAGPVTIPSAPSSLTAGSATSSSLTLNWIDNSNNEANFVIQRNISGTFTTIATVSADSTSYVNTGLSATTTYQYRVAANNSAGISAFSNVASGSTIAAGGPGTCTNVTQYGITWTFNQSYPCGQFANGDWWVRPSGPTGTVTVTSISPGTQNVGGRQINGAMINPTVSCASQGYDSSGVLTIPYQAGLNVGLNMPLVLQTSSSLVSTISNPTSGANANYPIQTAAILTVLNATPPTGAFRPTYIGNDKTIRYTESQIDYNKFANLPSIASTPSISSMESRVQRPWLQHCYGWASRNLHPTDNLPNYYREFYSIEGDVALILNTNIGNAQKRNLTVYLSQIGIDWFGYKTTSPSFGADADPIGHNNGKKFPILFAGTILNAPEMFNIGRDYITRFDNPLATSTNINYFSEDGQLFYVEETSSNVYNFGAGGYSVAHKGLPEWGNFHTGTYPGQNVSADDRIWTGQLGYRTCCSTIAMIGVDLAMKIMNLTDEWNNNAFRDYNDRYMEIELPSGSVPGNINDPAYYSPHYVIPDYTTRMWNTYRNNFGCRWERDNAGDIYSNGHYDCNGQDFRCSWSSSSVGTLVNSMADYGSNTRAINYDPCNVGLTGPVVNLKFDDTITDFVATDSSGNNLVGTCSGSNCPTYQSTGGQISGAYDFDGVDDRIVVADNGLLDLNSRGATMAWVRRDTSKWHGVITKGDAPTHSYGIEIDNLNRAVCQLAGTDYVVTSVTLNAGTYYHIACSWDDGVITAYIDGVARATTPGSTIVANPMTNTGNLYIGTWPSGGPSTGWDWMDGRIDDVRIFNRALSFAEIQSIVAEGAPLTIPSAPSSLTAGSPTSSSLTLNWIDNSNNEANFVIQRNISGTFTTIATVSAGTTSYVNTGLSATTTYQYRVAANNSAGISSFSNVASGTTLSAGTQTCTNVTQYGITWTFTSSVTCGQFANGDWWVVEPVTVQSVTPGQTTGRHGSWINPGFNVNNDGITGADHPFDDRTPEYNPSLRPTYPISFNSGTYPAGASLVSTESQTTAQNCAGGWIGISDGIHFTGGEGSGPDICNRGPIKNAAVLTLLNATPATDAFRPPYAGTDKTIRFTKSQLDYSRLGSVARVGQLTDAQFSIANVNRHIQRLNLQTSFFGNEQLTPGDNNYGYGQFMANDIGLASLIVNTNYNNSQKEPLVISLTQLGIDFYGVHKNSVWLDVGNYGGTKTKAAWYGLGGHGLGRLFPIIFAGNVLNDSFMKNVSRDSPNDYYFSELAQTFYVANQPATSSLTATKEMLLLPSYCSSGGINCGLGSYTSAHIGLPEFGSSHYHNPVDGTHFDGLDWDNAGSGYRKCCTATTWNSYVLASQIMGITSDWNSQAFLDYTDRYQEITSTEGDFWQGWYVAFEDMWDTYRNNYACRWERDSSSNRYSQGHYDCGGQDFRCAGSLSTVGTVVNTIADYGANSRAISYNPCNVALSGPAFNFTISRSPTSGSVQQGTSIQTNVTATYVSGTSSVVTFSASNLPSGITANFVPTSCTPASGSSCSSTLTLSASAGATVVSGQSVTISGTSGATVSTTSYSLTVTSAPTAPTAPSGLTVGSPTTSSLTLNWIDNSNNENNFVIQRRTGTTGSFLTIATVSADSTSYINTGLTANTLYQYQIASNNSVGTSSFTTPVSGTTSSLPLDFTISRSPTSGSVSQGASIPTTVTATYVSGTSSVVTFSASNLSSGVTASFSPASCTPVSGTPCSSTLTLNASAGATIVNSQQVVVSGTSGSLQRNTTYSLTVIQSLPSDPTLLTAGSPTSSSLTLNWIDNSNNENNFTIQRNISGTFTDIATVSAGVTSYINSGLTANTVYQYRIRANNNAGSSGYSNVASGTTLQTIPNSPTLLVITALSPTSLRANWNDNSNNEDGFILQYKLSSSSTWSNVPGGLLAVNTTTFTQTGLTNNTSYDYRLASYNSAGNSTFATASGTTQQNPAQVYTLARSPTSGSVQQSGSTQTIVTATYVSGTSSVITFSVANLSSGVTASFSPTSCTPIAGVPCSVTLTLNASAGATVVTNRQVVIVSNSWLSNINTTYLMNITVPPICTNGQTQLCPLQQGVCLNSIQTCTGNNWPGCVSSNYGPNYASIETGVVMCNDGLDNDCDGSRDLGGDSGCPIPGYGIFTQSLTTNFSQVTDFTNVSSLSLGIVNLGRIQFLENVNLWRLNAGVYSAISLDSAIQISSNFIRVNSESYPEFNKSALITFYNLSYSEIPAVMLETASGLVACPPTRCSIQSYNLTTGTLVVLVSGFSNYTTQASICGDAFCSSSESCSTCSSDCGACSSGTTSGSSGGSGGGGGGSGGSRPVTTVTSTQCNDGVDNDGDGKIDFPADPGCLGVQDNIELDETVLGGNEFEEPTETLVPENRDIQIGFVFWFVLVVLAVGIAIVGVIIANYLNKRRKFQEYVKSISKN